MAVCEPLYSSSDACTGISNPFSRSQLITPTARNHTCKQWQVTMCRVQQALQICSLARYPHLASYLSPSITTTTQRSRACQTWTCAPGLAEPTGKPCNSLCYAVLCCAVTCQALACFLLQTAMHAPVYAAILHMTMTCKHNILICTRIHA